MGQPMIGRHTKKQVAPGAEDRGVGRRLLGHRPPRPNNGDAPTGVLLETKDSQAAYPNSRGPLGMISRCRQYHETGKYLSRLV